MATATHSNANVALVRQVFELFSRGDWDTVVSMLAPDVQAKPSIFQAPHLVGRDAVARWWTQMPALEADVEARPLDFEAVGDCVLVRGYLRHRDGRTLSESQMYWLYEMRGGLIVRMESHPTRATALRAC